MATRDEAVIWHDVENGAYDADLGLWRELAASAGGPVLEVGCGTGRVSLALAREGHHVLGVDIEPAFVAALRERAEARCLEAAAEVGDVRELDVEGEFALVAVPMQTLQLLSDADERIAALAAMRQVLSPRGLIALAIVEGDLGAGTAGFDLASPIPDVMEVDGWVYSSLPLELVVEEGSLVIERLRQVVTPDGDLTEERSELRLAVVDRSSLAEEAAAAGLRVAGTREIDATDLHVGSLVVLLEAVE